MARISKIGRTARALGTDSSQASECQGDRHGNLTRTGLKQDIKVSVEVQQRVLNIFRDAFMSRMNHDFPRLMQEVKKNLFNRDFLKAFEREEFLETYALRWSPSRALAYMNIFSIIPQLPITLALSACKAMAGASQSLDSNDDPTFSPLSDAKLGVRLEKGQQLYQTQLSNPSETVNIVCLGGGSGAELVALAGYLRCIGSTPRDSSTDDDDPKNSADFNITILDVADWSSIIHTLYAGVTTILPISNFASAAVKANNAALTSGDHFKVHFQQCDILDLSDPLKYTLRDAKLVTLMFTLNELYSTSIKATTNLLLSLTLILSPGSLLLVVDSPGSYSTVNISKDSQEDSFSTPKKYPMLWLLDHTLLESASVNSGKTRGPEKQWEKLYSDESKWFRRADELTYPIELEDMRYQIHLYEKK